MEPATQRWIDAPWGPVFAIAVGLCLVVFSVLVDRSYLHSNEEQRQWSYARSLRAVHRYLLRPTGMLLVVVGVVTLLSRAST